MWYAENKIGKKAAVKLLLPKLGQDENVVSRFLNEAKVMVELDHPNIRQVYDYGDIDGRPAIVMEYLNGSDLKTRMKTGEHFSDEELQRWWNQMVDALNYTHGQDIVHRDIKPSNIFVDAEGNAKLLDFGIAKVRDSISATQTGQKLGTLMYMSPEQVRDPKRVGAASDAYSLAVTFVHLLTGKAPYDSTTDSDYDIQESIVRKPLDLSGVPDEWQDFLNPYLAKNPEDRPALSPFKVVASEAPAKTDESDDEGTIVGDVPKNPEHSNHQRVTPSAASRHSGLDPLSPAPKDDPHSKKGLWISLGIAALVALMLLIFWPKKTTDSTDPDTQAYEACETVEDYRAYMHAYGDRALHYAEAQAFVARWVADSTAKADSLARVMQETLALAQSRQQAEADSIAQAEAEREEEAAYGKCTTIAACEKYLKTYPNGRYVEEVKAIKAKLEPSIRYNPSSNSFDCSINGVSFVMKKVEGGTFQMGATPEQSDAKPRSETWLGGKIVWTNLDCEKPVHSVTVSTFYIGETEVTQALWKAIMGSNPSRFRGDNLPVEGVSWNDCQKFISKLNQMIGEEFRLPTEAEWEYAARGGNRSKGFKYAGSNTTDNIGVNNYHTYPVKKELPNELGLYNMSGNVQEWCSDWFDEEYYNNSPAINPKGPSSGTLRVIRGGHWNSILDDCRVSARHAEYPNIGYEYHGFRLALSQ